MIKECMWKGRSVSCSAVFAMQPTDRGMCCSFNKEKAEKLFMESRFRDHLMTMNVHDKTNTYEDSSIPDWYTMNQILILKN